MFDDDDEDEKEIDFEDFPVYKKGKEILDAVDEICPLIPDDDKYLGHVKSIMLEDAMMLTVKVAGGQREAGSFDHDPDDDIPFKGPDEF
jgi:hypothetical protein